MLTVPNNYHIVIQLTLAARLASCSIGSPAIGLGVDRRQCGDNLALCYFAVVLELLDSLWMNRKSEFGVIFLISYDINDLPSIMILCKF